MSVLDQAQKLVAAGKQVEAIALVEKAAAGGDGEALFAIANWRLFGLQGRRNIDEAHRLLERAGRKGYVEAVRLRATLIGNGTGCRSDPAKARAMLSGIRAVDAYSARQLSFAEKMLSAAEVAKLPIETLSEAPLIRSIRGFLTPDECRYIVELATPNLQPSFVVDPTTGRRMPHPVRTSTGMSFGPTQEDYVIHKINRRIARVTGTRVQWGEPIHVLNYAPGQEYRPHVDALPGIANQRQWTVLIYLNDSYRGGATRFELAGVEFAGREGDALMFRNMDAAGRADPATRHAGLPVIAGTKWLASRWIRQRRYHPWAGPSA